MAGKLAALAGEIDMSAVTHGHTGNLTYTSWVAMKRRCLNPEREHYPMYGGRGIKVCERWLRFENFLADMGQRPSGTTLDRIDNDGNYEPGNCRWATPLQQQANRSSTRFVILRGRKVAVTELARRIGMSAGKLTQRLNAGWPVAVAIRPEKRLTPAQHRRNSENLPFYPSNPAPVQSIWAQVAIKTVAVFGE